MKSFGSLTALSALALLLGACTSVTPEGEGTPAPAPSSHRHRTVGLARSAGLAAEAPETKPAKPKEEKPEEPKPIEEPAPEPEAVNPEHAQPATETEKPAKTESAAEAEKESGGFFSWLFGSSKDEEETPKQAVEVKPEVAPTPAQQAAAQKALRETPAIPEPRTESATSLLTPGVDDTPDYTPAPARNGLRLGNFAPPEEAASRAESTTPRPNAVELRGLRSPMLRGGRLPMDINGKLTTDKEDHE